MPNFCKALALLCVLLTLAPVAHAKDDDHAKDRAAIKAAYAAMDKAANSKDIDGAMKYIADNFVGMDADGTVTTQSKEERREKLNKLFQRALTIDGHAAVAGMTFDKRGAMVSEKGRVIITLTHNGQPIIAKMTGTFHDLWMKFGNDWLLKSSQTLTSQTAVNGQPAK